MNAEGPIVLERRVAYRRLRDPSRLAAAAISGVKLVQCLVDGCDRLTPIPLLLWRSRRGGIVKQNDRSCGSGNDRVYEHLDAGLGEIFGIHVEGDELHPEVSRDISNQIVPAVHGRAQQHWSPAG
jgi:hypothetical protein